MIVGPSPQFCLTKLLIFFLSFFGLAHPVVMSLIESMSNFGLCSKFKGSRRENKNWRKEWREAIPTAMSMTARRNCRQTQERTKYNKISSSDPSQRNSTPLVTRTPSTTWSFNPWARFNRTRIFPIGFTTIRI